MHECLLQCNEIAWTNVFLQSQGPPPRASAAVVAPAAPASLPPVPERVAHPAAPAPEPERIARLAVPVPEPARVAPPAPEPERAARPVVGPVSCVCAVGRSLWLLAVH